MPDPTTRAGGMAVADRATESIVTLSTPFTVWLHSVNTGTRLLFALQDTSLEANLRVLETWHDLTRSRQQHLLQLWSAWAGAAERTAEVSAPATEQAIARAVEQTEHVVDEAEARQHEREVQREQEQRIQRERQPSGSAHGQQAAGRSVINVVKREDDWAVMREDARRPSGTFDARREAVSRARELAERSGAEVHIESATSARRPHDANGGHRG